MSKRARTLTREEVDAIIAGMRDGVGLWRAAAEAEVSEHRVKRAMRIAKQLEDEDPHAIECQLARRVAKQRAKLLAKGERRLNKAIDSEDEAIALNATKFALSRLAPREYAETTISVRAEQGIAEKLLEAMREEISAAAYAEVVAFLAGRGLTEDE